MIHINEITSKNGQRNSKKIVTRSNIKQIDDTQKYRVTNEMNDPIRHKHTQYTNDIKTLLENSR